MDLEPQFAIFVPILVSMMQILKKSGFPKKLIPVLSICAGLGIGFGIIQNDIQNSITTGLFIGLSAVGTFSAIKNTIQKKSP